MAAEKEQEASDGRRSKTETEKQLARERKRVSNHIYNRRMIVIKHKTSDSLQIHKCTVLATSRHNYVKLNDSIREAEALIEVGYLLIKKEKLAFHLSVTETVRLLRETKVEKESESSGADRQPDNETGRRDKAVDGTRAYFHTLKINSLPSTDVCKESSKAPSEGSSSLKLVHKFGPCNPHRTSTAPASSFTEILHRDKLRVDSIIQARRSMSLTSSAEHVKSSVPFYSLSVPASSGLIWTQCKPCKACYPKVPVFDPTKSTSFKGLPCSSTQCQLLGQGCSSSKCTYKTAYVDNSSSTGIYATETISFNHLRYDFKNILIGCSNQVSGDSDGQSGIMGLNRSPLSFSSQTANIYNNLFSYCIPSNPESTGHLTFGGKASNDVKFSPISKTSPSSDYDIKMTGISVGGRRLLIDASAFKIASTIDSGAVLTRLPPKAYSTLRSLFREMMKGFPLSDQDIFLDTCYDFSNYSTVAIPSISVFFEDGVEMDIDVSGIMLQYPVGSKVYCLAFAELDDEVSIFGNFQQKTYTVVFDGVKERIGFAPGGCD
ncbi:ASPARTYL PROTEASES [Salix purpurea]|uniref:ASPARTYL PROTEASES n=1 Tax=Salix purpurea TaxID=77065 RepID=A0A9Q0ULS9_SALPP|nr:ASPARTYL PROTEASES [Salix purpurea]